MVHTGMGKSKEPHRRCSEYGACGESGQPGVDPMVGFTHVTLFNPVQGQGPFQTQHLRHTDTDSRKEHVLKVFSRGLFV